ncbi:PIN domain-containing protein [candidate division KSB1 bacterium]|nr:PIN domain-containing protein [candidate division KSB1 bacterium]
MKVLVDTSVWSLALRRSGIEGESVVTQELGRLIDEVRVLMIGPVRQELLSGIRFDAQFEKLRLSLEPFPDLPIRTADYEKAAEFFNRCRRNGIQGSNTDFLICAICANHRLPIFTTDQDFRLYQKYLPIALHEPR